MDGWNRLFSYLSFSFSGFLVCIRFFMTSFRPGIPFLWLSLGAYSSACPPLSSYPSFRDRRVVGMQASWRYPIDGGWLDLYGFFFFMGFFGGEWCGREERNGMDGV
jgi:hypothetical protein